MKPALELYAEAVRSHPRGLVSKNDRSRVPDHIVDSLAGLQAVPELCASPVSVVDVGSGGGFPGIPVALSCSTLSVTLIDSVGWKVQFLNEITQKLDINKRVTAYHLRVEDAVKELGREVFDIGTARAVATPEVVAEYLAPLVRVGGLLALWTTRSACEGLNDSDVQRLVCGPLGLGECEIVPVASPLRDDGAIVRWPKVGPTQDSFPRRMGLARNSPLRPS